MIIQTIQFMGLEPDTLYNAFLSPKEHSAMTVDGRPAKFHRPGVGDVDQGKEGDTLHAVGLPGPDGKSLFAVNAKVLKLVPGKVIVLSWKNLAWGFATNPANVSDLESTVVMTFRKNVAGSEINFVQVNVPDYEILMPDTGERGSLNSIINTHWSLIYWEPMKLYFARR